MVNVSFEIAKGSLNEIWLIRRESCGSYSAHKSEVHRKLLDKCGSVQEATETVNACHDRPVPYHLIQITIREGRIHSYKSLHINWGEGPATRTCEFMTYKNIAREVRLVTVVVKEQKIPTAEALHKARCKAICNSRYFSTTRQDPHDLAEAFTRLTATKAARICWTEHYLKNCETKHLSAREALREFKDHASCASKERRALTVYRFHLNRDFARIALSLLQQQSGWGDAEMWWSDTGYVSIPDPFFRFVFFTDETEADTCPIKRVLFEQYYMAPCEKGPYDAARMETVQYVFSRTMPSVLDLEEEEEEKEEEEPTQDDMLVGNEGYIAVLDYKMFYPHVMCLLATDHAYVHRMRHMMQAMAELEMHTLKKAYVKELGILKYINCKLYNRMHKLSVSILNCLVTACKQEGLNVITTQTDSVTVRVPETVLESNPLPHLAKKLQARVATSYQNFTATLVVERKGTNMVYFHTNKHILYNNEQEVVHRTGFNVKTFCPAMVKTIEDATDNYTQFTELLRDSTRLRSFVLTKMREHAGEMSDLASKSYALPMHPLSWLLHVQPGEDGLFLSMPPLYAAVDQYRKDNQMTMPTLRSFLLCLSNECQTSQTKHLETDSTARVLRDVFSANMGIVNWPVIKNELIEHFTEKTIRYFHGGRVL